MNEQQDSQLPFPSTPPTYEPMEYVDLPFGSDDRIVSSFSLKNSTYIATAKGKIFRIFDTPEGKLAYVCVNFVEASNLPQPQVSDLFHSIQLFACEHLHVATTNVAATPFYEIFNAYYDWAIANGHRMTKTNAFGKYIRKIYPEFFTISSVDGRLCNLKLILAQTSIL